jgi:DNA-binding transcriptional regulator GbsR (MarR family)
MNKQSIIILIIGFLYNNGLPASSVTSVDNQKINTQASAAAITRGSAQILKKAPVTPQSTDPAKKPMQFPLPIPHLGTIMLTGTMDMEQGAFSFASYFEKPPTFSLGQAHISNPVVLFNKEEGLSFKAAVDIAGQLKATLGLESFTATPEGNEVLFGLQLEDPFKLPITPWKSLSFGKLFLFLGPQEKRLFTQTNFASDAKNADTTLTFGLATEQNYVQAEIDDLRMDELISELKGNKAGAIALRKGTFKLINPFNKKAIRIAIFESDIDLSPLKGMLPAQIKFDALKTKIMSDTKDWFSSVTQLGLAIEITPFCTLKDPMLIMQRGTPPANLAALLAPPVPIKIDKKSKKNDASSPAEEPEPKATTTPPPAQASAKKTQSPLDVILSGEVDVNLPANLGTIKTKLASQFKGGKFNGFEGIINSDINFANVVSFKGGRFLISNLGDISIVLRTSIKGQEVDASLLFEKIKINGKEQWDTIFKAQLIDQTPMRPFANMPLPDEIKNIALFDLGMGFDKISKAFILEGKIKFGSVTLDAELFTSKSGVALKAGLDPSSKLSSLIPALKGSAVDNMDFSRGKLIFASGPYLDPEYKTKIPRGISFAMDAPLNSGPFGDAAKLVKNAPSQVTFIGSAGTSLADIKLQARIPTDIQISNKARMTALALEFNGAGPSVSLLGQMTVTPSDKDEPLTLTARTKIEPDSASIAATMQGTWDNPLGIKGLALEDIAVEVGIDYPVFMSTGLPTKFGITGGMQIGSVKAKVAALMTANLAEIILLAKLNHLTIRDIAELAKSMALKIVKEQEKILSAAQAVASSAEKITGSDSKVSGGLSAANSTMKTVDTAIANLNTNLIPDIGFYDVEIKVAPTGGMIGEITFDPGLTFKGKIQICEGYALININVDTSGFIAEAELSRIELGPVLISGKGRDGDKAATEGGPAVSVACTMAKQHVIITGLIKVLGASGEVEMLLSKNGFEFLTSLKVDRLTLQSLVEAVALARIPLNAKAVPDVGLHDVEFTIGMKGKEFKSFSLDPGITMKSTIDIPPFGAAKSELHVGNNGLTIKANYPKIDLGPLKISGSKLANTVPNPTGGPVLDVALTKDDQHFVLSGEVELLGSSAQTDIKITRDGMSFELNAVLFALFKANLAAESFGKGTDTDFKIAGNFDGTFSDETKRGVQSAINNAKDRATAALQDAQNKVNDAQNKVKELDSQIEDCKNILSSYNTYDKSLFDASFKKDALLHAHNDNTQKCIDQAYTVDKKILFSSNNQITKKETLLAWNPFNANDWKQVGNTIENVANDAGNKIKDTAEDVAKKTKEAAEAAAREAEKVAKKAEAAAKIAGLEIARQTAVGVLEAAKGILEGAKKVHQGTLNAVNFLVENLTKIQIRKAGVQVNSIKRIVTAGELPIIKLNILLVDKELNVELNVDLKDFPKFCKMLAVKLIASTTPDKNLADLLIKNL